MYKGFLFALGACFIWGLIFIVPQFMNGFTSIEIALGRYLFFASISTLIFSIERVQGFCRYPKGIWFKALRFSLFATIIYYTSVILALRYATPAVCALVLGISPITIAFYGNWKQKECSYKSLFLPSGLILGGLVAINFPHFTESESPTLFMWGLGFSLIALACWSWFVVANARFLKDHPLVCPSDWSTLIGVTSIVWVIICGSVLGMYFEEHVSFNKFATSNPQLLNFLIGCAILGLVCSWFGSFLWNKASFYLPVSLAGQLTIFETIFGVLFVYTLEQRLPPQIEFMGIAILLTAVLLGMRVTLRSASRHAV